MNFLTLCQRCATDCGVSGSLTTTANQTGGLARIVNWIGDAWNEIQTEHDDWEWMRSSSLLGGGVNFVPGGGQYTTPIGTGAGQVGVASDSFGKWGRETFRCVTAPAITFGSFINAPNNGQIGQLATQASSGASGTIIAFTNGPTFSIALGAVSGTFDAVGEVQYEGGPVNIGFPTAVTVAGVDETFLDWVPFDTWRNSYMLGAQREVQTRPVVFTIGPDQSINLGPPPNGLYTVTGDYFTAPTAMAADTDVPTGLPTRFHMLIVYKAMMKYAGYEAASEVLQRAAMEWGRMFPELEALRMPEISWAGALA